MDDRYRDKIKAWWFDGSYPLEPDEQVVRYVRTCNPHLAPMTFNVGVYQHGPPAEASVEQLRRLNASLSQKNNSPDQHDHNDCFPTSFAASIHREFLGSRRCRAPGVL
jgi:hypothetical protein